ncbi:MAG: hypothetical protein CME64_01075 [Halobacteriovoraceae bacterium]|nr:hypothetical protein [Halobacteriovoraceae bacterium]|tara:strand:- start:231314 stop:232243 length:930 start_codon:yes stop_codon:yes gene_type:complete
MNKSKAVVALFNCGGKKDILKRITDMGDSSLDIKALDSVESAFAYVRGIQSTEKNVLIFRVNGKKELAAAIAVLKASKHLIDDKRLRPVALMSEESVQVEEMLVLHGCRDIFANSVDMAKLLKKLNYWFKSYFKTDEPEEIEEDFLFGSSEDFGQEVDRIFKSHGGEIRNETRIKMDSFIGTKKELVNGINMESGILETQLKMDGVDHSHSCIVDYFGDNMIDLEIFSRGDIPKDTEVNVKIRFVYDGCSVDISTKGSIESYEEVDEGNYMLNVKLQKDESAKIENFMALFQKRQDEVLQFLREAQGVV